MVPGNIAPDAEFGYGRRRRIGPAGPVRPFAWNDDD